LIPLTESSLRNLRIVQSTGIVVGAAIFGRLLGFLREWTVAHKIGSNSVTDAYYAAFTLPDFISYLVAGGVLGIIFIPIFAKYVAEEKEDEAWYVFSTVLTFIGIALTFLIILGEIFTPQLVHVIAPGFGATERELVVKLTRILLPAQLFLCLGGLLSAVQNAKRRFLIPGLATVVYNFVLISCAWIFVSRFGITSFAMGLVAGVFLGFFALQAAAVWAMGGKYKPNLNLRHPGFRRFFWMSLPVMLALSMDVTDMWVIRWFGSYLAPSSITWLTYSRYLINVPVAVIGQAVGTASYPYLSQLFAEAKHDQLNRTISAGLKSLVIIMVPVSALTIVLCRPLIYFVFSHTRLGSEDYRSTAYALAAFAVGMFARSSIQLVSRGFNAAHDTLTPAWVGTLFTLLSLPAYWYCTHKWQYLGLAVASSVIAIILVAVLFATLMRRSESKEWTGILSCFIRVALASIAGAVICRSLAYWLELRINWQTFTGALSVLLLVTAVGLPLILLLSHLFGVKEIGSYWTKFIPRVQEKVELVEG
jgi:putative peptidoglycan lipid II flippase